MASAKIAIPGRADKPDSAPIEPPNDKAQRTRTAELTMIAEKCAAAVRGPLQREVRRGPPLDLRDDARSDIRATPR